MEAAARAAEAAVAVRKTTARPPMSTLVPASARPAARADPSWPNGGCAQRHLLVAALQRQAEEQAETPVEAVDTMQGEAFGFPRGAQHAGHGRMGVQRTSADVQHASQHNMQTCNTACNMQYNKQHAIQHATCNTTCSR